MFYIIFVSGDLMHSCRCRYDVDRSNFIDFMELKLMMEKLGEPQTHLALKAMIKEVDEDHDNQISFREVCVVCECVGVYVGGWVGCVLDCMHSCVAFI